MKIEKIDAWFVSVPMERVQEHETIPTQPDHGSVVVKITCEDGIFGVGRTYGGSAFGSHAVKACIRKEFAPHLIGEDAMYRNKIWNKLEGASHFLGRGGVAFSALSAIDIALWDIMGKYTELPIYKLLGAVRNTVPVYASEGWLQFSTEELVEQMIERKKQGFKGVKIRLPYDEKGCIERMKAVREALGPDFPIMVDVQNCWENVPHSVRCIEAIREYNPYWIEEPVAVQDFEGHASVFRQTGIAVAGGENLYSKHFIMDALLKGAFSYAQMDSMRIGGITEMERLLGVTESLFIPAVPHGAYDIHVHVALAHTAKSIPYVELLSDSEANVLSVIYSDFVWPKDGMAEAPTKPGLGFTLDEYAMKQFVVE